MGDQLSIFDFLDNPKNELALGYIHKDENSISEKKYRLGSWKTTSVRKSCVRCQHITGTGTRL